MEPLPLHFQIAPAFEDEPMEVFRVVADDTYYFGLMSDDGSTLYIDDVLVVDYGGAHTAGDTWGTIFLTAGLHSFHVNFFEDYGGPSGVDLFRPEGVNYVGGTLEPGYEYRFNKYVPKVPPEEYVPPSAVPEPSTLLITLPMLGTGLLWAVRTRRRREE